MGPKLSGGRLCALRDDRRLSRRAKLVGVALVVYEGSTWNQIGDFLGLGRTALRLAAAELRESGWIQQGRPPKLVVPTRARVRGLRPGFQRSRLTVLLQGNLSPTAKLVAVMMRLRGDRLADSFEGVVQADSGIADRRTWSKVIAELKRAGWLRDDGDGVELKLFNLGLFRAAG